MVSDLPLSILRLDGGTQLRDDIQDEAVADFAADLDDPDHPAVFPPVVAFWDGKDYWLADGFHRYYAHLACLRETIRVDVRRGSLRDAVLYAAGCNHAGSIRRTREDKKKSVLRLLSDSEWFTETDRWIASQCHVSHPFVGRVRREVINGELELLDVPVGNIANSSRTGRDGNLYAATHTRTPNAEDDDEDVIPDPPIPEEPPVLLPPPKDGTGRVIPQRLRDVFAGRWQFDRSTQLVSQLAEALQTAAAGAGGHYLRERWRDLTEALATVTGALTSCRPHGVTCAACKNKDAGCGVCGGEWWGPKGDERQAASKKKAH